MGKIFKLKILQLIINFMAEEKKPTKAFRRKIKKLGIYSILFKGKEINIQNSGVYSTDDPELMEIFMNDPELELVPKTGLGTEPYSYETE